MVSGEVRTSLSVPFVFDDCKFEIAEKLGR